MFEVRVLVFKDFFCGRNGFEQITISLNFLQDYLALAFANTTKTDSIQIK